MPPQINELPDFLAQILDLKKEEVFDRPVTNLVTPIEDVPANVLHLQVQRFTILRVGDPNTALSDTIEIYVSRKGLELLELSRVRRPKGAVSAVVFVEINRGDTLSTGVFEIRTARAMDPDELLSKLRFLEPLLARSLRVNRPTYQYLVRERIEEQKKANSSGISRVLFDPEKAFRDLIIAILNELKPRIDSVIQILGNYRMPHELWHPDERPADFNGFVNGLGEKLDQITAKAIAEVKNIEKLELVSYLEGFTEKVPGLSGLDLVEKLLSLLKEIERMFDAVVDFVLDIANTVKPKGKNVIDTRIGFLCGIWDGVVDAIIGMIETASLAISLEIEYLGAQQNLRRIREGAVEAIDEMLQALGRINWHKLWDGFREEILAELFEDVKSSMTDLSEKSLNELVDDLGDLLSDAKEETESLFSDLELPAATVGYYFGYLTYMVAEFFFPPLKWSKLASRVVKEKEAATEAAKFFTRLLSK